MSDSTTAEQPEQAEQAEQAEVDETASEGDELREGLLATLRDALGDGLVGSHISPGRELWVRVVRDAWFDTAELAKHKLGCSFFDFLSAIDWMPSPWGRYEDAELDWADRTDAATESARSEGFETGCAGGETRFQVFCRVANVRRQRQVGSPVSVVLKADLPEDDLRVTSIVPLYAGANWHERECWEMFGVEFEGHPGLRHIYLPGAFEGHPLRKDFPLLARIVKPWPGVVDVEPMPEVDEGQATDDGSGEAPAESQEGGS
jgi:NADH-quinone oxidoreductase subunit C